MNGLRLCDIYICVCTYIFIYIYIKHTPTNIYIMEFYLAIWESETRYLVDKQKKIAVHHVKRNDPALERQRPQDFFLR
jgi:hypothetical protein